jgi:hypothetical protein
MWHLAVRPRVRLTLRGDTEGDSAAGGPGAATADAVLGSMPRVGRAEPNRVAAATSRIAQSCPVTLDS